MITLLTEAEVSDSARAFLAAVGVAPDVLGLRPDYRVLVLVAEGLEPSRLITADWPSSIGPG
jgi:hypothetical protein